MFDGLWTVEFSTENGEYGRGVIVIIKNRILGGDGGYYYVGDCVIKDNKIKFAVLSTPMNVSQLVSEKLAKAGIRGILNMTGRHIRVPGNTSVFDINIVTGFEWLSYFISKKVEKK